MWKEFKEFVMRGNLLDMAIGIVLGVAFGAIITSLVNDIIMPPIGLLLGSVNFSNLFVSLNGQTYPSLDAAKAAGAPTINYGVFINTLINFLIIAFVLFLIIRAINRMRRKQELLATPTTKECPYCHTQIPIPAIRCPHCTSQLE
jgi:large conductance mechanosensitive channel